MLTQFHKVMGTLLTVAYIVILLRLEVFFPSFSQDLHSGIFNAFLMMGLLILLELVTLACFVYAHKLTNYYSPRFGLIRERISAEHFYFIIGYTVFCVIVTVYAFYV